MSFFPSLSTPPPPPPFSATTNGGMSGTAQPQEEYIDDSYNDVGFLASNNNSISSPSSSSPTSSSIVITIIVISSAIIVSTSIYLILRFLSRRSHPTTHATPNDTTLRNHINDTSSLSSLSTLSNSGHTALLDSLPIFTYRSVNGNLTDKDCAVCLSKFERDDQLRLLPLCCHAFHVQCIDAWLMDNESCPLCRSTVYPTDADVMNKVMSVTENNAPNNVNENINSGVRNIGSSRGTSFPIEIGSIRSHGGDGGGGRRSYSVGSFEYIVEDDHEISSDFVMRRGVTDVDDKESSDGINVIGPPGERLDGEVGGSGRNWLRDYMDRFASLSSSSRTLSFRSSGRFFRGSSRRNDVVVPVDEDLEASNSRAGEDISELFRWISGV